MAGFDRHLAAALIEDGVDYADENARNDSVVAVTVDSNCRSWQRRL